MKNEERDDFFIRSMLAEIGKIENFAKGVTYGTFSKDEKMQYAAYKAFENIGEAAKNISPGLKEKHPGIPWRELAGLRDKLTHGYFGIDLERIWKAIQEDIPSLNNQIAKLISNREKK